MKISKLFHWLYATLMFLPLVFFIPSCLYYGFNEHANANISQDTYLNFYQGVKNGKPNNTNDWFSDDDRVNIILSDGFIRGTSNTLIDINICAYCDLSYNQGDKLYFSFQYDPEMITNVYIEGLISDEIVVFEDESLNAPYFYDVVLDTYTSDIVDFIMFYNSEKLYGLMVKNVMLFNLTTIYGSGNEPDNITFRHILDTEYLPFGDNLRLVTKGFNISDSLNQAWNHVWDLPVFSWTKTCFLSAGFTYISGLFGVSATNSLNYVFGYWITISICWLVFDLLIYVPNLCHRWLDKGAVE